MPEIPSPHAHEVDHAAVAARLRALSKPHFDPRAFVKTIGASEIIAIVGVLVLVAGIFVIYSFWILPDQVTNLQLGSQVDANRARIEELQQQALEPDKIRNEFMAVQESLERFQGEYLKPRPAGRLAIINTVAELTRDTGVRLASPVSFATVNPRDLQGREAGGQRSQSDGNQNRSYPSLQMSFSITGEYRQLRDFIARFEADPQFVVIDGIALTSAEGQSQPGAGPITLEIVLTAFFQPDGPVEMAMSRDQAQEGASQ